jgi:hypothetical protein
MRHGQGERVPIPTTDEIADVILEDREIVAVSAVKYGPLIYMKFAFHNGDISTAALGPNGQLRLIEALKVLLPEHAESPAAGVIKLETERGFVIQSGHMSA